METSNKSLIISTGIISVEENSSSGSKKTYYDTKISYDGSTEISIDIPMKTSALSNDAKYVTMNALEPYASKNYVSSFGISHFRNDARYVTMNALEPYASKNYVEYKLSTDYIQDGHNANLSMLIIPCAEGNGEMWTDGNGIHISKIDGDITTQTDIWENEIVFSHVSGFTNGTTIAESHFDINTLDDINNSISQVSVNIINKLQSQIKTLNEKITELERSVNNMKEVANIDSSYIVSENDGNKPWWL